MTPQTDSQKKTQHHTAPNFSLQDQKSSSKDAGSQKKDQQQPGSAPVIAHQNFIRPAFRKTGQAFNMARQQYDKLPGNQRLAAGVAVFVLLFWPLFGLVMLSPWLLAATIVVYSVLFGFTAFVQDLEEAITSEMPLSENVSALFTCSHATNVGFVVDQHGQEP